MMSDIEKADEIMKKTKKYDLVGSCEPVPARIGDPRRPKKHYRRNV